MIFPTKFDFDLAKGQISTPDKARGFIAANFVWLSNYSHYLDTLIRERIDNYRLEEAEYRDLKLCLAILFFCFQDCPETPLTAIGELKKNLPGTKPGHYNHPVFERTDELIHQNFRTMFESFDSFVRSEYITVYDEVMEVSRIFILAVFYAEIKRTEAIYN